MSQPPYPPPPPGPPGPPPPPPGLPPPPYGGPPPYGPPPGFTPPPRPSLAPRILLAVVVAVLVLVTAIVVPVLLLSGDDDAGDTGDRSTPSESVDTSNLDAVQEYDGLTNKHLATGENHDYPQSPPVGGDHAARWVECGVHEQLPDNGILSPHPDQEAPVVITVWGRQLELTGPEDPRIELFIAEYGAGDTAPEPFASCHGGLAPEDLPPVGGPVV